MNITAETKTLQATIAAIAALGADSARIDIDAKTGLTSAVMDPSHVAMITVAVPNITNGGGSAAFTVGMDRIPKAAKKWASEKVTISLEDNRLVIVSGAVKREMTLFDNTNKGELPKVIPPVSFDIKGKDFASFVKMAEDVGDLVTLTAGEQDNTVTLRCGMEDKVTATHPAEVKGGDGSSSFDISYMLMVARLVPGEENILFRIGTDIPVVMEWKNGDVQCSMFVAPRVIAE